ncbi:PP2C family protein-serine/threonine phosphatase [Streptomyces sp. NPDC047853]|uniref:PP2C family protein-serine/threonine phosphatase n=1 Tax=unclassified Streptomyces TaxID=2593676 RepID=UPI003453074B
MTLNKPTSGSAVLAWMPWAAMTVVAITDISAGPDVGFLPLVSLGPAFAGLVGGWRRTTLIGAVAFALTVALGLYDGLFEGRRGLTACASVAGVTGAGIAAAVIRKRREEELASMRSIAEAAQRVLLRPVPLTVGPVQMAVSYTSAIAEARIGGDLYEVVASPYGVRVIVGDVQGKGLAAVETAAVVLGAFREAAHDEPDLIKLGNRLERSLSRELEGEKFVTAVLAEVAAGNEVAFLNFGHPAPMVIRADGTVHFAEPSSYAPPLGLGMTDADEPQPHRVEFSPGEQLLLYTDGVTEARDEHGAFYPLADRAYLLDEPDAHHALEAVRKNLSEHAAGPPHDDAAMLLVRRQGHPPAGSAPRTFP